MSDTPPRRPRRPQNSQRIREGLDGIAGGIDERVPPPAPEPLAAAMFTRAHQRSLEIGPQNGGDPPEGQVTLPRRLPLMLVLGAAGTIGAQVFWAGTYTTKIENQIAGLVENDQRITTRSDERFSLLTDRLGSLERDRDRLPKLEERFGRIEEKMTMMIELLRETRQERVLKR